MVLQLKPLIAAKAKKRMLAGKQTDPRDNCPQGLGKTSEALAKIAGVSDRTITRTEYVEKHGGGGRLRGAWTAGGFFP